MDLFKQYDSTEKKQILEPRNVRYSLRQLHAGSLTGEDFIEGNMGCAQETFDLILGYLHREYIYPNYLEEHIEGDRDQKFKID